MLGVLLASTALLTACSAEREPPPALTSAEIAGFYGFGQLTEDKLPRIGADDVQANVARRVHLASCMAKSGYAYTEVIPSAPARTNTGFPARRPFLEVQNLCWQLNPVDPTKVSLLGAGQRAYVYDYYIRWLVPCLELSGLYSLHSPPTLQEFIEAWRRPGWWTPYESIGPLGGDDTLYELQQKCAPMPAELVTG
jgi:hypothetical protein